MPSHYPGCGLVAFVVMPNHFHGIILITATTGRHGGCPTMSLLVPDTSKRPLEEQNRSRGDRARISEGLELVERARSDRSETIVL